MASPSSLLLSEVSDTAAACYLSEKVIGSLETADTFGTDILSK